MLKVDNIIKNVRDINGVRKFYRQIIREGTNIHPDDDFKNIVDVATGKTVYTVEEAERRNQLNEKCFEICEKNSIDIYDLAMTVFLKETKLSKWIPYPSQN